ncbi:hypothetical protein GQ600_15003 [Phytophthora cactorum]|nr:hypothetical protein GQ600_15003 [Phytophthora cactorum]
MLTFVLNQWFDVRQRKMAVLVPQFDPNPYWEIPLQMKRRNLIESGLKQPKRGGGKRAGEVTLDGLTIALDYEPPSLNEIQWRLSGIIDKFSEAENKKPKFKRLKNPVLIMDPFYILPSKLLDACLKVLPIYNTEASATIIDDDDSKNQKENS